MICFFPRWGRVMVYSLHPYHSYINSYLFLHHQIKIHLTQSIVTRKLCTQLKLISHSLSITAAGKGLSVFLQYPQALTEEDLSIVEYTEGCTFTMLVLSSDYHGEKQMKLDACIDFFLRSSPRHSHLSSKELLLY